MAENESPPSPPANDNDDTAPPSTATTSSADQASDQSTDQPSLTITFHHHGTPHTLTFPSAATLTDLSTTIAQTLHIPPATQKFMITPKPGLLKPPFPSPPIQLSTLTTHPPKKITLLAPTPSDLSSLSAPPPPKHILKSATPARTHDWRKTQAATLYTFHAIVPLPHLPHPTRSLAFLRRLASDPGIKSTMATHRFSVGTLTEMDPAEHTTHSSRTLGLNRNRGEVIELRLRTDAYDGYRDYKVIRDTLCHELAHNVHGEHDGEFWALCRRIEGEVKGGDWRSGGQAVGAQVYYDPAEGEGMHVDGGGWVGGSYVLGSGSGSGGQSGGGGVGGGSGAVGGDRREAMARAAEERMRREREAGGGEKGGA